MLDSHFLVFLDMSEEKCIMAAGFKRPRIGRSGSKSVEASQSGQSWYFAVTETSFQSLDALYDAVAHAQRTGNLR
jgi:hypothetical protein